jgi:hypothetical protein
MSKEDKDDKNPLEIEAAIMNDGQMENNEGLDGDVLGYPRLGEEQQQEEEGSTTTSENNNNRKATYKAKQELLQLVSERHVLNLSPEEDEMLDPLERAVRAVVPIPKRYYWDVVDSESKAAGTAHIPTSIKLWHSTIAALCGLGAWTNAKIAVPITNALGLNDSRFAFVTNQMTEADMVVSVRLVAERQRNDADLTKSRRVLQEHQESSGA